MARYYVFLGSDTRGKGLSLPSWDSYFNPQKLKLSALALKLIGRVLPEEVRCTHREPECPHRFLQRPSPSVTRSNANRQQNTHNSKHLNI